MFPIHRACYRTLDPDWEGEVFVADIDRTYLATRFSSLRGMARIPFEAAEEKEDIAGMARLFREIRRGPDESNRYTPLYFVSASPSQLRRVIEQKMSLDGIGFDGTTFKNWGGVLRRLRLSRLREQIGFKLTALLSGRAAMPVGAREVLIGDDLETDPLAYALYADILAGRIPTHDLRRILTLNGVNEVDARDIVDTRRDLRPGRGVRRAYIRMERHANPEWSLEFAPGVVGCSGPFQIAIALWKQGSVAADGIARVAAALVARGADPGSLGERLRDMGRRALIDGDDVMFLARKLSPIDLVPHVEEPPLPDSRWVKVWAQGPERLWTPARYLGE